MKGKNITMTMIDREKPMENFIVVASLK